MKVAIKQLLCLCRHPDSPWSLNKCKGSTTGLLRSQTSQVWTFKPYLTLSLVFLDKGMFPSCPGCGFLFAHVWVGCWGKRQEHELVCLLPGHSVGYSLLFGIQQMCFIQLSEHQGCSDSQANVLALTLFWYQVRQVIGQSFCAWSSPVWGMSVSWGTIHPCCKFVFDMILLAPCWLPKNSILQGPCSCAHLPGSFLQKISIFIMGDDNKFGQIVS